MALSCVGVSKSFGDSAALTDVDLAVEAGEIHVLLGENGAGKSTLMKIAAGVHRADAGQVVIDGVELTGGSVHEAQEAGVQLIHQEPRLFEDLDVTRPYAVAMTTLALPPSPRTGAEQLPVSTAQLL